MVTEYVNGHRLDIGLDDIQLKEALAAIEYWKDAQLNNFLDKSAEYINYCHKQKEKIQEYIRRNT